WELDHTELAWVRDLGRRAVLLGRSLAEMAALRAELERGVLGVHEAVDASGSDNETAGSHARDGQVAAGLDDWDSHPADGSPRDDDGDDSGGDDTPREAIDGVQESFANDDQPESESVAMDLASDSDQGNTAAGDDDQALQAAKTALLSRFSDGAEPEQPDGEAARLRLRVNMRATLDMILTVAGEFY
ncbi:hypothetical protein RF55_26261, partial [Lasius niger]